MKSRQLLTFLVLPLAAVCLPLALLAQSSAPKEKARLPVPSAEEQAAASDYLRIVYKDDYAKARTDVAARAALAARLLDVSRQKSTLPKDRYVQLREARDLAVQAGDTSTGYQAAEEMAEHFAVSAQDMKLEALAAALPAASSPEAARALVQLLMSQLQEALDADRFDPALRLAKIAEQAAARAGDKALSAEAAARTQEVQHLRKIFPAVEPARQRLAGDPDDAQANLTLGKYLGPGKGNWSKALFYLAQGSDPVWRLLAQRDLSKPEDPKERLRIADDWWDLAEKAEGAERVHLQQRAVFWYELVVGGTRGFQRGRLEERIAAVPRPYLPTNGWDYNGRPGEIQTLLGHNSTVYGVAFAPDGRKILSGSVDNQAAVWDLAAGANVRPLWLQGHGGMVWAVAYAPDGKHVFTASWDGTVRMWDAGKGTIARQFPGQGRIADINGLAVSRDGKYLLTGSDDSAVRLWNVATGQEERAMQGHQGFVYGVAFSPDGKQCLSGGASDRKMILWNLQTGQQVRSFMATQGSLRTVAFSPDGRTAVHSGGNDVDLIDLQTGQPLRHFRGHAGMVYTAVFSPDGKRLATGGADRSIRLWDVATGREVQRFDGHTSAVFALAFSPGGGRLVSGGQDNTVRLWGLPR
jgi:WD40 repeat protein